MHGRALVAVLALILVVLAAACGGEKPVIKLHDGQWESLSLNNAIFEFIVENGYGYPVETVVSNTFGMQEALPKGEVDLNLEGWQQNIPDWYNQQLDQGNIVNLGMTYEGGPQFFIIPKWVAEQHQIETVQDMTDQWELFRDPQDPSKGVFYNCPIGFKCQKLNEVKLEAYGLTRYYNLLSPASNDALAAVLARYQDSHQPVVGFYWAPTALVGAYDWHILEEPPHDDACRDTVIAASDDPNLRPLTQACAYESLPVDKLAHRGLMDKAPDVAEMLRSMNVGLDPLNATLAWASRDGVQEAERMADYYLRNYEDRWRAWVTPKAYGEIKEALEKSG
tara:strand:- start:280 stop:1287 length:1008 start_codon:yes stop_codon:yes gene_type:complete